MAFSAESRLALLAAGQLRSLAAALSTGRNSRRCSFGNGQLMGNQLRMVHQSTTRCSNKHRRLVVSNVATTDVAPDSKVGDAEPQKTDPPTVVAVILGGSTRLFPLTKRRAKPAVPIGGEYMLIDVPMSNCINNEINKVHILTQYNSASLNRHISRAYNFGNGINFGDGYVEVLAAFQTPGESGKNWFQGTADADKRSKDIEDVLILSGDHLYRMDYMDFVQDHRKSGANIVRENSTYFGLMKIDNKGRVLSFSEKPRGNELKPMAVDTTVLELSYIASMGVYVFKKEILLNLLRWRFPTANDFGSEIIQASAKEFYTMAYLFNDYWEDIGTIKSFFEANLALTEHPSKFSFYDVATPICTSRRNLPPSKIDNSKMMKEHLFKLKEECLPIGIGENTQIKGCIIDKNVRIGKNVVIANWEGGFARGRQNIRWVLHPVRGQCDLQKHCH